MTRSTHHGEAEGAIYRCRNERGRPMVFVDDRCAALTGHDSADFESDAVRWGEDVVHPDERDRVWHEIQAGVARDGEYDVRYRVRTADGGVRRLRERGRVVDDPPGEPAVLEGVVTDVTDGERGDGPGGREHDEPVERVLEAFKRICDPTFAVDADWRITVANERAADLVGRDRAGLAGASLWTVLPEEGGASERLREALSAREPVRYEATFPALGGRFAVLAYPSDEGATVVLHEPTAAAGRPVPSGRSRGSPRSATDESLDAVVRELTGAILEQRTREGIERLVCDRLAESDLYRSAWIGDVDYRDRGVAVRAEAGDRASPAWMDAATRDDWQDHPVVRAARKGEIRVTEAAPEEADGGGPGAEVDAREHRTAAAVPVTFEDAEYGVLCVHADRPGAFDDGERRALGQFATVIGHALAAIECERALASDETIEVEFRLRDVFADLETSVGDGAIRFDRTVPVDEGIYLAYGSVSPGALDALSEAVDELSHWAELEVFEDLFGEVRFEVRLVDPPVVSEVAAQGGTLEEVVIAEGDCHVSVRLPRGADVRRIAEVIRRAYGAVDLVSKRSVSDPDRSAPFSKQVISTELTDRQRAILEAAYSAGYFEWPRESTGEEIAESFGISAPTFHQHLRRAENTVFGLLFDGSA